MAGHILTNAKEATRYTSTGTKFMLGGAVSGAKTIKSALAISSGVTDPDTEPCDVTVRYRNPQNAGEANASETFFGTYNTSDNSITRVTTISSTSGVAAIAWNESASLDDLVIYGTRSHASDGVRTLQDDIVTSFGTLTSGHTTTTFVSGSTLSATIQQTLTGSRLLLTPYAEFNTANNASGQSFRSRVRAYYKNSSSVYTATGETIEGGGYLFPTDVNMGMSVPVSTCFKLTGSELNASGDWEIKPYIATFDGGTVVTLASFRLAYREVIG